METQHVPDECGSAHVELSRSRTRRLRYLWWPIVLLVGTSDVVHSKVENYALKAHVEPLRLSQLDLVNLLNKTMNVVKSANASHRPPPFSDEHKRLRFGDAAGSVDLSDEVSLDTLRR